jgi:hypothetical protein
VRRSGAGLATLSSFLHSLICAVRLCVLFDAVLLDAADASDGCCGGFG